MPTRTGNKKSIAFLLNSLEFGGAQRVFIDDANEFAHDGFDLSFFVLYAGKTESALASELDPAVHQMCLEAKSPHDLQALKKCVEEIKRRNITTLITTLNDGNRAGEWIRILCGSSLRLIEREANTLKSKTTLQKILDIVFFWVPYRIIAVSSEIQKSLIALRPFSKKKIVLLPNAISAPQAARASQSKLADRAAQTNLDASVAVPPFIFSVGRLTYQKNYELLVRVLEILNTEGILFTATIVGEGIARGELEKQVADAKLQEKISFVGHLPYEKVLELYEKADIFVATSRWEGSPNVVLEALSYGIPVVATKVGGVSDIIQDGVEGLLVPSEDAIAFTNALQRVISDLDLRAQLSAAAKERIRKEFSREARFARLRAIVNEN